MNYVKVLYNNLERDSLSDFLPASAYDQDRMLYHNDLDSSAGFILEISPVTNMGTLLHESLTAFLSAKWPKNTIIQFMLYADPNLDQVLLPFRSLRGTWEAPEVASSSSRQFLHNWAMSYADHLESRRYTGIDPVAVPVPFRNFRAFCTVKVPCTFHEFETRSSDVQLMIQNRSSLVAALKTCSVACSLVKPGRYIRLMYQLLNPNHPLPLRLGPNERLQDKPYGKRPYLWWDVSRFIGAQMIDSSTSIRQSFNRLRVDRWHVQTKTPALLPAEVRRTDINMLIGEMGAGNMRQIEVPFLLTLTLCMNSMESMIIRKGNLVLGQRNALPSLGPKMEKRHQEFLKANLHLGEGVKFIQGALTMTLYARTKSKLESACAAVEAIWQQQGYKLQNEWGLNLPLFMMGLPMVGSFNLFNRLKKGRTAPAGTWAMLAPIQADAGSASRPIFTFISRRGQLTGLDLRDSPRDYNCVVFAPTGSGKSFLVNFLVTTTLSVGGRAFILDIGRSYEKLNSSLNGQYIEFTPDSAICLNVFGMISHEKWLSDKKDDLDEVDMHRQTCEAILHQMANPSSMISDTEKSFLDAILSECFDELAQSNKPFDSPDMNFIDMVVGKLEEMQATFDKNRRGDNIPGHLARRLFNFSSKGKHGRWFQGKYNLEFDNPLVVLELEELAKSEDLRQVALMLVMSAIEHRIYLDPDRSRPTMMVMDEAWDLITGANTASFMEHGFRRARKYGASYVVISQSIFDMKDKNEATGNAILNNCSWKFFLSPKKEELERAVAEKMLSLSEYEIGLMSTATLEKGKYSEICCLDPHGQLRISRLYVDKRTGLLFTTDPNERELLDNLRANGMDIWQAICAAEPNTEYFRDGYTPSQIAKQILSGNDYTPSR